MPLNGDFRMSTANTMRIFLFALCLCLQFLTAYAENQPQQKTQIWEDGTKYQGSVVNGKRHGKGTITWPDGSRYVGYFKNDLRNGPGTMTLPDGTVYSGYFVDDKLTDPPSHEAETAAETLQGNPPVLADLFPPVTELTDEIAEQLRNTLDMWAAAWSEKNAEQYLANYAADFKVPGKLSRRQWEIFRRGRLRRPSRINVTVQLNSLALTEPNIVEIRIRQIYKSNLHNDTINKLLRMKRTDEGDWKILSELVVK